MDTYLQGSLVVLAGAHANEQFVKPSREPFGETEYLYSSLGKNDDVNAMRKAWEEFEMICEK